MPYWKSILLSSMSRCLVLQDRKIEELKQSVQRYKKVPGHGDDGAGEKRFDTRSLLLQL